MAGRGEALRVASPSSGADAHGAGAPDALILPEYVVVDARLFYHHGRLSLDLSFKNVTNETYFNGNGSSLIFPGEPFSVLGRVAWSF
jgi:outer membrane receptor protein involved in Fe transport